MIEIRPANEGDLNWLVGELREFNAFYKTKKPVFGDEGYVRNKLIEIISYDVFIVATKRKQRIGFIAGLLRPHFYNPDIRCLSELFWWVIPTERRTIVASMLMDAFVSIGRDRADWITLSMAPMTPVKCSSFIKRGFVESDKTYLLEVC